VLKTKHNTTFKFLLYNTILVPSLDRCLIKSKYCIFIYSKKIIITMGLVKLGAKGIMVFIPTTTTALSLATNYELLAIQH